jgi:hypothetical protein
MEKKRHPEVATERGKPGSKQIDGGLSIVLFLFCSSPGFKLILCTDVFNVF